MVDFKRRRTDRMEDDDWCDNTRDSGIENRLLVAAPGDNIQLREGTEELLFDDCRNFTWGEVMGVLVENGVFTTQGNGLYTKQEEGFGLVSSGMATISAIIGDTEALRDELCEDLGEIVDEHFTELEKALNLSNPVDLLKFIELKLGYNLRLNAGQLGLPDFCSILPELASSTANLLLTKHLEQIKNGTSAFYDELFPIIFSAIEQHHDYRKKSKKKVTDCVDKSIKELETSVVKHPCWKRLKAN